MSGNSWGHAIKPLERVQNSYGIPCTCSTTIGRGSKRQHCTEPARYAVSYWYVTGRQGRTTDNRRFACAAHAQTFAHKHNLELPAAPLLHLHKWKPGDANADIEQCLQCGRYRTRTKDRWGLFAGYASELDLTFCTPVGEA